MTPAQTLTQDIQVQIAKGDLLEFSIVRASLGDVLYTLSFVKDKAIVRLESKAHYELQRQAWILTSVEPIDREIELIDPLEIKSE